MPVVLIGKATDSWVSPLQGNRYFLCIFLKFQLVSIVGVSVDFSIGKIIWFSFSIDKCALNSCKHTRLARFEHFGLEL